MNKVASLEFAGLMFDTCFIPEGEPELEVGRWTSLDKIDKYFYEKLYHVCSDKMVGPRLYTFQMNITASDRGHSGQWTARMIVVDLWVLTDLDRP